MPAYETAARLSPLPGTLRRAPSPSAVVACGFCLEQFDARRLGLHVLGHHRQTLEETASLVALAVAVPKGKGGR